jgi:excisionase family DNA binding protein
MKATLEKTNRTGIPSPGGLLTVAEAAEVLGVSDDTVRRMVHAGCFRVYWPTARRLWIFKRDVEDRVAASVFGEVAEEPGA